MYEAELNDGVEASAQIPGHILERFGDLSSQITARTVLPWGEHCTECQYPACYATCDLYSPRLDGNCRQFVDGMVRIDVPRGVNPYLLKIRFKRWGKLWTLGNTRLVGCARAAAIERRDIVFGDLLDNRLLPRPVRGALVRRRGGLKKRLARYHRGSNAAPSSFVFECYNPNDRAVTVTISAMQEDAAGRVGFHKRVDLPPGFTRERLAVSEMAGAVDLSMPFQMEIVPNDVADGTTLVFGLMDFVQERAEAAPVQEGKRREKASCKCVVWDLDNTLWKGVLVEDGPQGVALKDGILDVIRELDRRGILHSIASKNNEAEAVALLRRLGIEELFLHPQIGWGPKSQGIGRIAAALDIGVDTLVFVDDQAFEREEVKSVHPGVTVLDAGDYRDLLDRPACRATVTAESANRRALYRLQAQRAQAQESFGGNYLGFLRECQIRLTVRPCRDENMDRVYELAQRTNQMNFSGNRYERSRLAEVARTPEFETYVMECQDRFGTYGTIGFGIVDAREPRLLDLMFSCRIQGKRVEHAFLGFLLRKYRTAGVGPFHANYRKTDRNAPSGRVFAEMGFEEQGVVDGVTRLAFPEGRAVPDDDIIDVIAS